MGYFEALQPSFIGRVSLSLKSLWRPGYLLVASEHRNLPNASRTLIERFRMSKGISVWAWVEARPKVELISLYLGANAQSFCHKRLRPLWKRNRLEIVRSGHGWPDIHSISHVLGSCRCKGIAWLCYVHRSRHVPPKDCQLSFKYPLIHSILWKKPASSLPG